MKVTSKQWWILLAVIQAALRVTCATKRPFNDTSVDIWTNDGRRPAHSSASEARAACSVSGADRMGWEFRVDGSVPDVIRRIDIEIPRAESSGTASFFAGVTTMRDGALEQWVVETRPQAALRIGEGRAWVESSPARVSAAIIARLESGWYFLTLHCPMPH